MLSWSKLLHWPHTKVGRLLSSQSSSASYHPFPGCWQPHTCCHVVGAGSPRRVLLMQLSGGWAGRMRLCILSGRYPW